MIDNAGPVSVNCCISKVGKAFHFKMLLEVLLTRDAIVNETKTIICH